MSRIFCLMPLEYARTFLDAVEIETIDQHVPVMSIDLTLNPSQEMKGSLRR